MQSISQVYVVKTLNAIQTQFISMCTLLHNLSGDRPSVCNNQTSGKIQRATDWKICNQAYIIDMLVGIENGL